MRTTVVIPDSVFRKVKAEAAMEGRTLREFFVDAVVHELERSSGLPPERRRANLPLVRSSSPGTLRLTGDAIAAAMTAEELHVLA